MIVQKLNELIFEISRLLDNDLMEYQDLLLEEYQELWEEIVAMEYPFLKLLDYLENIKAAETKKELDCLNSLRTTNGLKKLSNLPKNLEKLHLKDNVDLKKYSITWEKLGPIIFEVKNPLQELT